MQFYNSYLPFCILLFSTVIGFTQQPLNLNFERLSVEGINRPWGWTVSAYSPTVTAKCDNTVRRSGNYSLKIEDQSILNEQPFEYTFFVEPSQLLDKKLSLSGWIKNQNWYGDVGLKIQSYGTNGVEYVILQKDSISMAKNRSSRWQKMEVDITLTGNPHSVEITLYCSGSGTLWYDQLALQVDGNLVDEVPVAQAFSVNQRTILRDNAIAFRTVKPLVKTSDFDRDFIDLAYLWSFVGDAEIIALGESTHGTREFFELKHRVLQYAILRLDVRVFVLEDNQLAVERINNFVLHNIGTVDEAMKGLFAVWSTLEMRNMITWLHRYNFRNPDDPVAFVGMDIQNPTLALDSLDRFLGRWDKELQTFSNNQLSNFKKHWQKSYYKDESILSEWVSDTKLVYDNVLMQEAEWLAKATSDKEMQRIMWAVQNARLIYQCALSIESGGFADRDKAMAENISWIKDKYYPGKKLLVWAHDSHVSRGDAKIAEHNYFNGNSMGAYLSKKYGDKYYAFGLFTYEGECTGTISYSDFTQVAFDLFTSPLGTLDEILHMTSNYIGSPYLMLDLRPYKKSKSFMNWMTQQRPVRYVGYVAEDYGFGGRYSIPYQFDTLFFVDKTGATTPWRGEVK